MDPMNPFERKVVHDVVADAGLFSDSSGTGPGRHVVIYLDDEDDDFDEDFDESETPDTVESADDVDSSDEDVDSADDADSADSADSVDE